MAYYFDEPSRTFNEYLLVPGHTPVDCVPAAVSLKTPLVKYRKGEEDCPMELSVPMVSAIMAAVSDDKMAVALATGGGLSFIYGNQSIEDEAAMVARVKDYKAGFVTSDANLSPDMTLAEVVDLKDELGHSTMPVTEGGTPHGKLLGIVTERDYRLSRMSLDEKVADFMTPREKLVVAPDGTSLKEANDIIWDHKLNSLPIVDGDDHLVALVFRKDYDSHKSNPDELLDSHKRYMVGAGINTKDYAQRVPALVEAGADVLCIDSSEGYSCWQERTLSFIRERYGDSVKVGAGNVVDRDGFLFLAEAGAADLTLTLRVNDNWVRLLAESVVGDWNAVGVTAEVVYLDQTALFADISEPPKKKQVLPFDAVLCPGDPSRFGNDPDLIMNWWYGSNVWTLARSCWAYSKEFDTLADLLQEARIDEAAQQDLWNQCFDIIAAEAPLYPLFHRETATAYFEGRLSGYDPISATGLLFLGTTPMKESDPI